MGEASKPLAPETTALPQGYIPAFSRLPAKTADSPSRHPALADGGSTVTGVESYAFPYEFVEDRWVFTDFHLIY